MFLEPETESGGVDATKDDKTDDLIATAQEKERAGDLDGALDSYAQAFSESIFELSSPLLLHRSFSQKATTRR